MIEKEWKDGEIYIISFETNDFRVINKMVILPPESKKSDVENKIFQKFNSVNKVISIDEWGDCLIDQAM